MSTRNWIPLTLQINEDSDFPVMDSIINNIVSANTAGYPALNNKNYLNCEVRAYRPLPGETTVNWSGNPFMVGDPNNVDTTFTLARVEGNLNIASGAVVTTPVRKLGLGILVTGNLTIAGQINMTAKGANHRGRDLPGGESSGFASNYPGRVIRLFNKNSVSVLNRTNPSQVIATTSNPSLPDRGGDGSNFRGEFAQSGQNFFYGATGGGGVGAAWSTEPTNGLGANGSTFSGGTGGGGKSSATVLGFPGTPDGGAGGAGSSGGAGNPMGNLVGDSGSISGGTGGVIILVVLGNLTFNAGNNLISSGTQGRGGFYQLAYAGGGSGGGSVNLIVSSNSTITGTINSSVSGGLAGAVAGALAAETSPSRPGADGSIQIYRM